ncbi:uncharacterized protein Dwil_GK10265 [Drosophila willistoni]|uniref:YEATS domain-containing protein n=1 Tax=Drosophila willistoni TaxID=7260 RepID=B4MJA1_DROWI|nr:uncharacterized protein Dwil_GK10265 [Drosophila willistoni]
MQNMDISQSRYLLDPHFSERSEEQHKRIIIGSISRRLDEPRDRRWTHQFRVYVKAEPVDSNNGNNVELDEDELHLGDFVQQVVFRFSDECANCISIVDGPPFQSNSYCSQDLSVTLTLLFRDVHHSCTIFHHQLKLQSFDALGQEQPCVLSEHVETITFVNPSRRMMKMLKVKTHQNREEKSKDKPSAEVCLHRDLKRARKMVNKQKKYLVDPRLQFLDFFDHPKK